MAANKSIIVLAGIIFLFLSGCGNKGAQEEVPVDTDSSSVEELTLRDTVKYIQYTQFLFDKTGAVVDSFRHNTSWIKYLNIGKKQLFPDGFAALQQPLNDTIHRVCELECELCELFYPSDEGDTNKCLKTGAFIEQFKPTEGDSYFNSINYLNYYFFLTQVDSCFISVDDTEYGFLNFMKLKTKRQKLEFTNKVIDMGCNETCPGMELKWKSKQSVYLIENKKVFTTSFNIWNEVWECGQKADYASRYAKVNFKPVKGIFKSYSDHGSPLNALEDPRFIFSYILMDETKNDLKIIQTKSYAMQLITVKGEIRRGKGLDLNNDKHADVFWYDRKYMKGAPVEQRNTVLYIKIGKDWTPVYINNFSNFY